METLHSYYRNRLKAWVGIVVVATFFFKQTIVPWATDYAKHNVATDHQPLADSAINFVGNAMVGVLFLIGEWFIRKHLWKIENPTLDFDGRWDGETTYSVMEKGVDDEQAKQFTPFASKHGVAIEQDCVSISIKPDNKGFATWRSLAMNILGPDSVGYAYKVVYTNPANFPADAVGYEEMDVVRRQNKSLLKKGWPMELSGNFYHCAKGTVPIYRGTVTFKRV